MNDTVREATISRLLRGFRLAILVIVLVTLFGLALPSLVSNASTYLNPTAQVVAFITHVLIAAVAGVDIWRDRFTGTLRWVLLAAAIVAHLVATAGVPATHLVAEEADWSFGVIGWLGLLLLLDRGVLGPVLLLAVVNAVSVGHLLVLGQDVLRFAVGAVLVLGYQLPVVAGAGVLRRFATSAAEAVHDAQELRTAEAVAEQIQADRKARYAGLAETTVPLLNELATGRTDLSDDRVRTRYAVEAARVRRLFAENDEVPDPLLHELKACLDVAERKGIAVHLDTWGERPVPPVGIRRALTEPAVRILATAVSTARVTLLGSGNGVTVSIVADSPSAIALADESPVTVTTLTDEGLIWVEASWWT